MQPLDRTVERELAQIADEAHGVVTRAELARAGVSPATFSCDIARPVSAAQAS